MTVALPALYPIVNISSAHADETRRKHALAMELAGAGATLVQLRAKNLAAGAFADLAGSLVRALRDYDCRLIVNDRADIATAVAAAGVHLGDADLPPGAARRVIGASALLGFSTHSPAEAAATDPSTTDYIGFGPVYESPTKAGVREARGIAALRAACERSPVPVVAIGGVVSATAADVFDAGAQSCAVISEIEQAQDKAALASLFERYERRRRSAAERR